MFLLRELFSLFGRNGTMKLTNILLLALLIAMIAAMAMAETRIADVQHARAVTGALEASRVASFWNRILTRQNIVATLTAPTSTTVQVTSDQAEAFAAIEALGSEQWL